MIHIVTSDNRHLYGPQLRTLDERRRLRGGQHTGWVDPAEVDGGEIDNQDAARVIHLLGFSEAMELEVALRLIADGETPRKDPDVWEACCLLGDQARRWRGDGGRIERLVEAWAAAVALGLVHGVTRFVGMIDMRFYPDVMNTLIDTRLVGLPRPCALGIVAGWELALSRDLLDRLLEAIGRAAPLGYHVDAQDLIAFGDLAAVQRQVVRAMTPQISVGAERDETLAAETLFRLHDAARRTRRIRGPRGASRHRALNT